MATADLQAVALMYIFNRWWWHYYRYKYILFCSQTFKQTVCHRHDIRTLTLILPIFFWRRHFSTPPGVETTLYSHCSKNKTASPLHRHERGPKLWTYYKKVIVSRTGTQRRTNGNFVCLSWVRRHTKHGHLSKRDNFSKIFWRWQYSLFTYSGCDENKKIRIFLLTWRLSNNSIP